MKQLILLCSSPKFLVLGDQLLFSGSNFIVTIFLARILGAQEFGLFASTLLFIYLVISVSNALIVQPFQVSGKTFQDQNNYTHFLFFTQMSITVLVVLAVIVVNKFLPIATFSKGRALMFMAGMMTHDFFRKFYLAKNQLIKALIVDATVAFAQVSVLLFFCRKTEGINFVFLFMACCYLPAVLFSIHDIKPILSKASGWRKYFVFHSQQAGWLTLVSFIQWGSGNLLVAVSGFFLGLKALGVFRFVQSLFGVLNILFQSFENYVLPRASIIHAESIILSKKYIQKVGLQSVFFVGVALSILFFFSSQILDLASGGQYEGYGYVIQGMCLLYFILFLGSPIRLSIRLLLLNKSFFMGYMFSFLFSVCFFKMLLHNWQINGIVIGLVVNQIIMIIYWTFQLNKNKFLIWK